MINSSIKNKRKKVLEGGVEGAKKAAISLLAYKEQTEKELFTKLLEKGFSREDAAEAVAFTIEKQYLSEKRYYMRFAEFCGKNKHFGRRRIVQEARRKGFSEKTIEKYTEEALADVDFDESCYEALTHFRKGSKEKLTASLLRRGFTTANVRYAFMRYEQQSGGSLESLFEESAELEDDLFDGGFADDEM